MVKIDPRKRIGTEVHAYAKHVTSEAECARLFGSNASTRLVNGVTVGCRNIREPGGNRENWKVIAVYKINTFTRKQKALNIKPVKLRKITEGRAMPPPPIGEFFTDEELENIKKKLMIHNRLFNPVI